jgi:hypothetical protein
VTAPTNIYQEPQIALTVSDVDGKQSTFASTGLHETYEFTYNEYTGELTVERVAWGPRGNDEWARTSAVVVAAWPTDRWSTVTLFNSAVEH